MPPADDDRRWDPLNFEDEDEMLLWDTGAENVSAPFLFMALKC